LLAQSMVLGMAAPAAAEQQDEPKGADKALLAALRAWVDRREANCEFGFEARGGSMQPMLVSACMAETTRARTRELKAFVSGDTQ
jgi:uncharacterized protein YecT (DUF1311 family)